MSGPAPALRLAEDAEGRLADAQSGNCPACVRPLPLSGGVLTFVAPPDEGPVVPDPGARGLFTGRPAAGPTSRSSPANSRATAPRPRAQALAGAVGHARGAVEAAAQALAAAGVETARAEAARAVEKAEAAAREAVSTATAAQTEAAAARAETKTAKAEADRAAAELAKGRQAAGEWKTLAGRIARAIVVFLVKADPYANGDYYVNEKRPCQDLAATVPESWRERLEAEIRKGAQ